VQVTRTNFLCYLNGKLVQTVANPDVVASIYVSSSFVHASNQIVVKAVNPTAMPMITTFNFSGVDTIARRASLVQLASGSPLDTNSFAFPARVAPVTRTIKNAGTQFTTTLPANSLSVLCFNGRGFHFVSNSP